MISVKTLSQLSDSKATTHLLFIEKANWEAVFERLKAQYMLSDSIKTVFNADKQETLVLYPNTVSEIKKVVLVGLGEKIPLAAFRTCVRTVFHQLKPKTKDAILVEPSKVSQFDKEIYQIVLNASLGWQPLLSYKKATEPVEKLNLELFLDSAADQKSVKNQIQDAQKVAESKKMVMDLVNAPSNFLGPKEWAKQAKKEGEKRRIHVQIFKEDELEKKGFGAITAVGKGASDPARFIILDYKPESFTKTVALIGKGVTFDTGGVSIKQSTNLHFMKCDMAGGANVMGTVCAAADLKLPIRVVGLIPAVQNMLDGSAMLPSDIVKAYNGLTIEIIDTDAEGRLILADALAYAALEIKPDIMVDLATLTGASVTALGHHAAALFTNAETLSSDLEQAGITSGDRLWRLPLWDEYAEGISADMADLKNYGGPAGGAIFAAKFLERFTESHPNWAHLDIAGMVLQSGPFAKDRVATGYGVELLIEFLKSQV